MGKTSHPHHALVVHPHERHAGQPGAPGSKGDTSQAKQATVVQLAHFQHFANEEYQFQNKDAFPTHFHRERDQKKFQGNFQEDKHKASSHILWNHEQGQQNQR